MGIEFMVQYKDGYGALHNVYIVAEDIDGAWTVAEELLGSENRIQFICKAP